MVVPGSVANLGGGFDTLGVAVQLYLHARIVDVRDDGGSRLTVVESTPPVHGQNAVERAFAAIVERTGIRAPSVFVEIVSDVPMAAGLGSSAAATVAGLRLFERVAGAQSDKVLLGVATAAEGHADNAAPALFGGLTSVVQVEGEDPRVLKWSWPDEVKLVVATPAIGLATAKARAALPAAVPRADAIFNLQRALMLLHALQHGEWAQIREAVKDRWHQPARASMVPLLDEVLAIDDAAVLGGFLSGAGPSVAVLARHDVERVAAVMRATYERANVAATVRTLSVHQNQESGIGKQESVGIGTQGSGKAIGSSV
ncbi:MAG TPA: homoserine kinase [Vicinamibacterales bacterium]|nr:homoserine kinase [Vicinamibacterales bacterium]